jgi:GxxExxY protein
MLAAGTELEALAHKVVGAAIEVHRELGPGYAEEVYADALAIELALRDIAFKSEHRFEIIYKTHHIGAGRVDLLVCDKLIVELKCVDTILAVHRSQVLGYLRALDLRLGLILNFKTERLVDGIARVLL